jgi:hypothetical protein
LYGIIPYFKNVLILNFILYVYIIEGSSCQIFLITSILPRSIFAICHCLSGLAVAADDNFKTFEAAYPYVVQKLLTDNSAATRKILHSVCNVLIND